MSSDLIPERIAALGEWFHNIDLRGHPTAPHHFLGDYPAVKWRQFADAVPADLRGRTVLDIGCNGGFYAIEMKKRGTDRVVGIDSDDQYLAQARFAAGVEGLDVEYRKMSVYEVAALGERFDLVIFMGVLYHLRHPLLALDLLHEHVVGGLMLFQSMQRGSTDSIDVGADHHFWETELFDLPAYPKLHFVEHRYANDPTNWWVPNAACAEAMLRSAGFEVVEHPEQEVYLCRRGTIGDGEPRAVYPARGAGGR